MDQLAVLGIEVHFTIVQKGFCLKSVGSLKYEIGLRNILQAYDIISQNI